MPGYTWLVDPVTNLPFNAANPLPMGSYVAGSAVGTANPLPEQPIQNFDTAALITHAAASAGVNGTDQINNSGRGINLVIDVTAITGTTPTLTVTLQGKDIASGKYYTILASAAISAVGTTVLQVFPGATAAANAAANAQLPRTWRVISVIGGTTPAVTATVGASVIE